MTLRYWNAIGWGAVSMVISWCLAWVLTDWMIETIILMSIMAFLVVTSLLLATTAPKALPEQKRTGTRRDHKSVAGQFVTFKLEKEAWKR